MMIQRLLVFLPIAIACGGPPKPSAQFLRASSNISADMSFQIFSDSVDRIAGESDDPTSSFAREIVSFQIANLTGDGNDLSGRCVAFFTEPLGKEEQSSQILISQGGYLAYSESWSESPEKCQDVFLDAMPDMSVKQFFNSHVSFFAKPG